MSFLKYNWIKISVLCAILIVAYYFWNREGSYQNIANINNAFQTPVATPSLSKEDPRILAIEQSLPKFEDYPIKVYSIPPKPKLIHESNPYGMRYWTLTDNWVKEVGEYNMGGHFLMDRFGTGNPDVIIIDGLTGQVFQAYGSIYPHSVASSSLVVFDPIDPECFKENGDYEPCYDIGNPRYAVWDGKRFLTICEAIIKNWKLVTCGDVADKHSEHFKTQKIAWTGTVAAKMTYGRLRIKSDDIAVKQYGYSDFVVEPDDVGDSISKRSETTDKINIGDYISVVGYLIPKLSSEDRPWISIERISVHNDYR